MSPTRARDPSSRSLIGRLTIDSIVDVVRDESSRRELQQAGLNRDEDMFASPWDSARNRWPWLGINLITAFVASRVIGRFEPTIQQVAALAALLYSSLALGAVMSAAVLLNLVVAALSGVAIPIALHAGGYDPAHGSSVLLTFITDAMGFFLFLGLATAVLL